jgi:hypothetical protein
MIYKYLSFDHNKKIAIDNFLNDSHQYFYLSTHTIFICINHFVQSKIEHIFNKIKEYV